MNKEEKIRKIKEAIESIRKDVKAFRECCIIGECYNSEEAKIFRKGFNQGYKLGKQEK